MTTTAQPTRDEVTALIAKINTSNRLYHGGTHTDLIAAVAMLERLMPSTEPNGTTHE